MSKPISILIGGGIGDIIVSLGILKELEAQVGELSITCNYPEVYEFYMGKKAHAYQGNTPLSAFHMQISNFSMILRSEMGTPFHRFHLMNQNFVERFQLKHYLEIHPLKDGIASDIMLHHGFTRETLPAAMLGFANIPFVKKEPEPLGFWEKDYITIHDGYGLNHVGTTSRATKTWDLNHWAELVQMIKSEYPHYKIVQLGAETGRRIQGVDYSFLGSFSISQSFQLLSRSRLHIDGDSGMVHAAKSFDVPCVVLFGPTPAKYFGYPENINIQAPLCKPCWWDNDTWVSSCPKSYQAPICMNSIFPTKVFLEIKKKLEKKGTSISTHPLFIA